MNQTRHIISYQALLDALPEAALILDEQFFILACNQRFLALLRQKSDFVIDRPLIEILPDSASLLDVLKPGNREETMLLGRFLEASLSTLDDADGASLLLLYDKTVSKLTEQALLSHEQRYRALFENSNDAVFILESDLTIIIANEQAAAYLAENLEQLLRRDMLRYIPKDQEAKFRLFTQALLRGEIVPLYESLLLGADNQLLPVEISLTLVRDSQRQPLHIQFIARDIQERRRSEEILQSRLVQLDTLLQVESDLNSSLSIQEVMGMALDSAMYLSRADAGFIALSNEGKLAVSHVAGGYFPAVIGSPINYRVGVVGRVLENHQSYFVRHVDEDPYYYRDIPATQSLMAFPLISQERLVGILNLESFDAEEFNESIFQFMQVLASRIAVSIENARLYEFVRKQLNELSTLYNELHEAEKLKTDMMRIANHDLRNPLATVHGYVDLLILEGDKIPAEAQEYLLSMRHSLERAEQILHDFLSAEAITARAKSENLRFELRSLVERAIEEFRPQAAAKGLKISQNISTEESWVRGDEVQIYEAMTNLISNAIKYTPEGGSITIELAFNAYHQPEFRVRDTGFGIPLERQTRLFEPFYRPKTPETSQIEGTGLGLHLVKNIIERHHGKMIFESVYKSGSLFGFSLPYAAAD